MSIKLRDLVDDDLLLFFTHQQNESAQHMAAFISKNPDDKAAFMAHWSSIRANDTIIIKTILFDERVVGHVLSFIMDDQREISYWIDSSYWGKGIATAALSAYLEIVADRPLMGRVAKDNIASKRVLEKCGFTVIGVGKGFANARNAEIEEYILELA
ncbi:MAG: GNAT family N-acetyltransferase [Phototrophicaceae bacterium]